jgi:Matrixin
MLDDNRVLPDLKSNETEATDIPWTGAAARNRLYTLTNPKTSDKAAEALSRNGSLQQEAFRTAGRLYLLPNINKDDVSVLRAGGTLADKRQSDILVAIKLADGTRKVLSLSVIARDYGTQQTFFGDRPLANPGYSSLKLSGNVVTGATNDRLDAFKVEQRLRYLGWSRFGEGTEASIELVGGYTRAIPSEIKVDGVFDSLDASALKAFYGATHFINGLASAGFNRLSTESTQVISSPASTGNFGWLNAYNAPHWMNLYTALPVATTGTREARSEFFADGTSRIHENYSTSWTHDLLKAWQVNYRAQGLTAPTLQLNGFSDPSFQVNAHGAGGHSVGMALDLGFSGLVSGGPGSVQEDKTDRNLSSNLGSVNSWSVQNASSAAASLQVVSRGGVLLTGDQLRDALRGNNQGALLLKFLSLYALTINDSVGTGASVVNESGGTWDDLTLTYAPRASLFGTGSQATGMIPQVLIGGTGTQNKLLRIGTALGALGVRASVSFNHHNHFHVYFRTPPIQRLSHPNGSALQTEVDVQNRANVQYGLNMLAETDFGRPVEIPEKLMEIESMTDADLNDFYRLLGNRETVVVSQSVQSAPLTLGACAVAHTNWDESRGQDIAITKGQFEDWFKAYTGSKDWIGDRTFAKIIRGPKFGRLTAETASGDVEITKLSAAFSNFTYSSNPGSKETDSVLFEVNYKNKVYRLLVVIPIFHNEQSDWTDKHICKPLGFPKGAAPIKISPDRIGLNIEHVESTIQFADLKGTQIGFAALGASALESATIYLDSEAAGHGWFVDGTPESNAEFLPTADANILIAKDGSDAAGKMDMLSVLLHEYGHVLGIEHNADSRNFMSPILQPGVRKLPTPEELQLMANLVAEMNATQAANAATTSDDSTNSGRLPLGLALGVPGIFGLLRRPELQRLSASWSVAGEGNEIEVVSDQSDMLLAANSTLLNGNFAGATTAGTWSAASWAVSGSVSPSVVTLNGVTLGEGGNRQASVSQAFLVSPSDQFLSFTVKDELTRNANGPQDAF